MRKIASLALLMGGTLAAGAALAGERMAIEPMAPSFVRELGSAGTATIGGTVAAVEGEHFTLADPEGAKVRVDCEHLALEGLAPGQMITVTGWLSEGELEATHAIREDGSVAARDRLAEAD